MKTAVAAGSKAAGLDFRKSLLEVFAVNKKTNQVLLSNIDDPAWQAGLWGWGTLWRDCGFGK